MILTSGLTTVSVWTGTTNAHSVTSSNSQITTPKPQNSTRDSPSCLATVLGLRDVRTTTPYGRRRHHPLPTWITPTGFGERISRVRPPRVPALQRRDLLCSLR